MLREITIPVLKAYRIALLLLPVMILVYGFPYFFRWHEPFTERFSELFKAVVQGRKFLILFPYILKCVIALVSGIFLHEALHGLGWVFFTKGGFKSLKFGFTEHEMAPYAHCREPLPVFAYRLGIVLPGILLGVVPALAGIISGHFLWWRTTYE